MHLPNHRLSVFVVVPQRVDIVRSIVSARIDAHVLTAAQHNLLAPVADQVARETRVVLRPVVHVAARRGEQSSFAWFVDLRISLRAGRVQDF